MIRLDFGRILPGIVLLIAGFLVFLALLGIALVAFFFSFTTLGDQVMRASLGLLLVPVFLMAAGGVILATGVAWWRGGKGGWLSSLASRRAHDDSLRPSARVGEVFGAAIAVLIFFFLYANQQRGVAFFTASFDQSAMFFFYGPLLTGVVLSLARAAHGRRNGLRPLDSLNALFLAVASFWLLSTFPFDFTHFADMFPSSISFIFAWLSDDIGRVLLLISGIVSAVNFAYTAALYAAVRGELMRRESVAFREPFGLHT